eukprot:7235268-Prymnesium_polylepis.1
MPLAMRCGRARPPRVHKLPSTTRPPTAAEELDALGFDFVPALSVRVALRVHGGSGAAADGQPAD